MNTKKLLIIICILANQFFNTVNAQAPQSFNYQAVARDASGVVLSNQAVSFRISLLQGSATGTNVYSETHAVTTNIFGLVNFAIGGGTIVSGSFANINWAQGPYFAQIELDATGGSTYVIMNTTQLLSVPYAQYAEKSGNPTLQAGSGIAIQNDSIINTAQNQQVNLSGTGQTNITGTYPNYVVNTPNIQAGNGISVTGQTITNTAPDQTVTINGTGQTNVTGTYPNFTVNTPPYTAGTGINISGTNISAQNTNAIWNANKLQGKNIDTLTPALGNVLQYDGSKWKPSEKLPQMTTAQREALTNVYTGMTILNTNTDCIEYYNGTKWFGLCGTEGEVGSSETGGLQQGGQLIVEANLPDTLGAPFFSINNEIYYINYNSVNSTNFYSYNVVSNLITIKNNIPITMLNPYVGWSYSNNGYLFTMTTTSNSANVVIYQYNPSSDIWNIITTQNFSHSMYLVNYIGTTNNHFGFIFKSLSNNYFARYNFITNVWSETSNADNNGSSGISSGVQGYWKLGNNIAVIDDQGSVLKNTLLDSTFVLSFNIGGEFANNSSYNWSSMIDFGNRHLLVKSSGTGSEFNKLYEVFPNGNTFKDLNININPDISNKMPFYFNGTLYFHFIVSGGGFNKLYKLKL
jgi:hypothetical protein